VRFAFIIQKKRKREEEDDGEEVNDRKHKKDRVTLVPHKEFSARATQPSSAPAQARQSYSNLNTEWRRYFACLLRSLCVA
jgi:hypothetical protein